MAISPLVDANCEVIIRDPNLEDNGEITRLSTFESLLKVNDVSSWQINMNTSDYNLLNTDNKSFTFGDGIMFKRDNELIMSGPVLLVKTHYVTGDRTTTIIGADDDFWLTSRLCYPVVEGMIFTDGVYRFGRMRQANGITTTTTVDTVVGSNECTVVNTNGFQVGGRVDGTDSNGLKISTGTIAAIDYPANKIYLTTNWGYIHPVGMPLTQSGLPASLMVDDPVYLGYDTRIGPAETVMKELVYYNAGEGACVDQYGRRAIDDLIIPTNHGAGLNVTSNARGEVLMKQLQDLAVNGQVFFELKQVGTDLVFDVFKGNDLTANADLILSVESGTLKEYEFQIGLPLANMLIGVGPNPGVDKIMLPTGDLDSIKQFGRFEAWSNASQGNAGDTPVVINAAMLASNQSQLLTTAYQSSLSLTIQETDQVRFPRDFNLGDKIRTMIGNEPSDQIVKAISYSIPAGSGGGQGSALGAFLKRQMSRTMIKVGQQGDLLKQLLLNS
jgi:hypothetical protein